MVKLQKPIPKTLGDKPKLDNPIKQKKKELKKEKSTTTKKAKLLEDTSPVKEAKVSLKPAKEVLEKKQKKKKNDDEPKTVKKPLVLAPQSPEPSQNGKAKKNKVGSEKKVSENGVKKVAKETAVPEKIIKKAEKAKNSEKPAKPSKQDLAPVKQPKAKSESIVAPPKVKTTEVSEKVSKKTVEKVEKPGKPSKEGKAPVPKEKPNKKVVEKGKSEVKQAPASDKKSKATPVPIPPKVVAPQKKVPAPPKQKAPLPAAAPQKNDTTGAAKQEKKGKKQKNKKKGAAVPETEAKPAIEKIKKPRKPKLELQEKKKAKIAFKKAKLAAKGDAPKKEKKSEEEAPFRYDPIPYDEEQFKAIVKAKNIKKIVEALKTTVSEEVKTKKSTIFEDYRYFLQVASFKIPSCPKRMVRLNLKHSLVDKEDDVLLIVPDLQRGIKADYEPTKHHYEDLLRKHGVEGITVMPMAQLRKEYRNFETKLRLGATYEYFMCDGRIIGHAGAFLGKLTQKTRNILHPVRLHDENSIKAEIEKSLRKTAFRQLSKSSLQSIPVGTHKFNTEQLVENIEFVVEQLKKVFPGGLGNIRNLHLKIGLTGTSSLPLYISMAQAPEETPMVIGPREERMLKLKREANEVLAKFTLTKEGKLIKLPKAAVEKKRKLMEMKTALQEEESAEKPAKKVKKSAEENGKEKKKAKEVKELELPEEEQEEDETSDDDNDEDVIQLGQDSDEDEGTEDDDMANVEEDDTESGAEVVENGFVGEDDEESDEEEAIQSDDDDNDDDEEEDDGDDDDDEEDEDIEESD